MFLVLTVGIVADVATVLVGSNTQFWKTMLESEFTLQIFR